jgi:hypothetical protein
MNVFYNMQTTYTQQDFFFVKCSNETLRKKTRLIVDPNQYYCLPPGINITMSGVFGGKDDYISVRVNVDFCINGVFNRTDCLPKIETVASMRNLIMHIILYDHYTDSLNYTDPFVKNNLDTQIMTNANTFSRQWVYFKTIQFDTDIGALLSSTDTQSAVAVDQEAITLVPAPNTNTIYSNLYVTSKWNDSYKRNYIKIQGVFAFIGGFLSISQIVFQNILDYFIKPDIVNVFYKKYEKKEDHHDIKIKNPNADASINMLDNSNFNNYVDVSKSGQSNSTTDHHIKPKKKIEFKFTEFTSCEKVFRCFCIKTKKYEAKTKQLNTINQIMIKKFSMEHFTNLSTKNENNGSHSI